MNNPLKLITFDSTGTLITVRGSVGEIYAAGAKEFGFDFIAAELDRNFIRVFVKHSAERPNFGYPDQPAKEWWRSIVLETMGLTDEQHPMPTLDELFLYLWTKFTQADAWCVYPEVFDALDAVRSSGIRMGVISNFDERLPTILANMGLADYFDFILCSRVYGVEKPGVEIFEEALRISGVRASESLHVGDSKKDYTGAKSAGMASLLLERGEAKTVTDMVSSVRDLNAVVEVVRSALD